MRVLLPTLLLALLLAACEDTGLGGVVGDGTFEPAMLDFGIVSVGESKELEGIIHNLGVDGVTVETIQYDPERDVFRVDRKDGGNTLRGTFIPRNGQVQFVAKFIPRAVGDYSTVMNLTMGDAKVALPIKAEARQLAPADPRVVPDTVSFTNVARGTDASQRISIFNDGESPGRLRDVRSASGGTRFVVLLEGGAPISGSPEILPGGRLDLELHFRPDQAGTFSESFQLDFGQAVASLGASGTSVEAGRLDCVPSDVDFGPRARGEVVGRDVHCTVTGGEYVLSRIGLAAGSSTLFTLPNPPGAVTNGQLDFHVDFAASGLAAEHEGVVEMVAAHGSLTGVRLHGRVTPPDPGTIDLQVALVWSADFTDLDVHLVRTGGSPFDPADDCHFGAKNPDWGSSSDTTDDPYLDIDNATGYGPEEINLLAARDNSYEVYVHYFKYLGVMPPASIAASLRYSIRGGARVQRDMVMLSCGSVWHVGRFTFGGAQPVFTPADTMDDSWQPLADPRCR